MNQTSKRNTLQKKTVLEIVTSMKNHPSAEQVYQKAREVLPSISLATGYRILRDAAACGTVQEVTDTGAADRFDFNTSPHGHFVCKTCGKVYDIALGNALQCLQQVGDVTDVSITLRGVCDACKKAGKA